LCFNDFNRYHTARSVIFGYIQEQVVLLYALESNQLIYMYMTWLKIPSGQIFVNGMIVSAILYNIHCPNFSGMFQAFFASQNPLQLSFENCSRHLSPFFYQLTFISRCSSLLGKVRMKCLLRAVTRRLLGVSMSLPEPDNYQIKKNRTVGAGQTGSCQGGGIRPGRLNRLKKHRRLGKNTPI
jgi:hypothetical protein